MLRRDRGVEGVAVVSKCRPIRRYHDPRARCRLDVVVVVAVARAGAPVAGVSVLAEGIGVEARPRRRGRQQHGDNVRTEPGALELAAVSEAVWAGRHRQYLPR